MQIGLRLTCCHRQALDLCAYPERQTLRKTPRPATVPLHVGLWISTSECTNLTERSVRELGRAPEREPRPGLQGIWSSRKSNRRQSSAGKRRGVLIHAYDPASRNMRSGDVVPAV